MDERAQYRIVRTITYEYDSKEVMENDVRNWKGTGTGTIHDGRRKRIESEAVVEDLDPEVLIPVRLSDVRRCANTSKSAIVHWIDRLIDSCRDALEKIDASPTEDDPPATVRGVDERIWNHGQESRPFGTSLGKILDVESDSDSQSPNRLTEVQGVPFARPIKVEMDDWSWLHDIAARYVQALRNQPYDAPIQASKLEAHFRAMRWENLAGTEGGSGG